MEMSIRMNDARNQIAGYRVKGRLQMKQQKYAAARADYERCFDLIFKYRQASANPQLRMDALEEEQAAFRGYFDLMMRAVAAGRPGWRSRHPARRSPRCACSNIRARRALAGRAK
jgi:hypothetical protein